MLIQHPFADTVELCRCDSRPDRGKHLFTGHCDDTADPPQSDEIVFGFDGQV